MRQKYQVCNITRKPKPTNGPDTRTLIEKRGHYVAYRNAAGNNVMLRPGEVKIINEPNEDVISLVTDGYLSCEPLKDIADALQSHKGSGRGKKKADDHEAEVAAELADASVRGKRAREARASMMGETQNTRGVTELEGAVNPDGNPNFTVTATKNSIPKRQSRQR
jgi:hypothetical protein